MASLHSIPISTGGEQALMEAQRFPTDYNGILGGDPGNNRTHLHTALLWNYLAIHAAADGQFTSQQAQAVSDAVVAACGVNSGSLATDPFLTDPRTCNWDPGALQCTTPVSTGSCLNADQVQAARLIYQGPIDPVTGHRIFEGSVRGGEADSLFGWAGTFTTTAEPPFASLFKWVFGLSWLWPTFDFDQNMAEVDRVLEGDLNANDTDLSQFQSAGGRLLIYHGWADALVSPQDSINYYMRVVANQGNGSSALKKTQQFYRLFMVPGMYHCVLGPGPNAFGNVDSDLDPQPPPVEDAEHDALLALEQWVERGIAPQKIIATKYVDDTPQLGIAMQRPICPFPQVPRYSGTGSTNVASNFVCVNSPATTSEVPAPEYLQ
jgi:feruloyl esterase